MFRRIALLGLVALAATACKSGNKSDPVVAKGDGFEITASQVKKQLDEQAPFLRARYSTPEQKKEFVDKMVEMELMAREAEKEGLDKDPDIEQMRKRMMVQKLWQKKFQQDPKAAAIPADAIKTYYDGHKAEFFRPKKVRGALVAFSAPAGSPDRAAKKKKAAEALAKLKADEKKTPLAFVNVVQAYSDDPATKATNGDLSFKSQDELTTAYGPELADAIFKMKSGETSDVLETPKGFYIVRVNGAQDELNRTLEQATPQIEARLLREKRGNEFTEWRKQLKEKAKVEIDDKAIAGIELAPVAAPGGGVPMGGPMGGMPMGHPGGAPGAERPAPAIAPAPAPAAK
ncbi:MAG: peptidylprolyl isomerase [Anaeromyxobacter sp.]